jgi:CheY-like chemotaxis protein
MQQALLVDDSKSARIIISRLLQKHGLEVLTAETGEAALEIIKDNTPDVIFMDYMMPGLNGIETMKKVHANPATAHVPVVICTGNEGDSYFEEAVSEGASSLLSKPPSDEGIQKALSDTKKVLAERKAGGGEAAAASAPAAAGGGDAAIEAAKAELRAEFDKKIVALRKELAGGQGGGAAPADLDKRFKQLHMEIERSKKQVFDALVQRMQQQQAKLIESIKGLLAKQRSDTLAMIKKAMGKG